MAPTTLSAHIALWTLLLVVPDCGAAERASEQSREVLPLATTQPPTKAATPHPSVVADDRCPPKEDDDEDSAPDWVKKGGIVAIVFGILVSFWSLAVVVEEYFVPALNIMCVRAKIPDDVAGATFMAAGASSPEMFSAIISLFITHSALGAGTIIGSEIFNHLCICAGAVLYSKTGVLELDWRILVRETSFYAIACGLLVFSMAEIGDSSAKDCDDWVWLRYYHGLILMGAYVVYALVCSFYGSIRNTCCPLPDAVPEIQAVEDDPEVVAVAESDAVYARLRSGQLRREKSGGRVQGETAGDVALDPDEEVHAVAETRVRGSSIKSAAQEPAANFVDDDGEGEPVKRTHSSGSIVSVASRVLNSVVPGLHKDRERFLPNHIECFIWKKSRMYNTFRVTSKTWQMRWCHIDDEGFCYYKGPDGGGGRAFNIFEAQDGVDAVVEVTDERRNIFELTMPKNKKQKLVVFQAQNPEHVLKIVQLLRTLIAQCRKQEGETEEANALRRLKAWETAQERAKRESGDSPANVDDEAAHEHEPLIAWPRSTLGKVFHVILFPFKAAMYYSMVDVRDDGKQGYWPLTCLVSVVWLAVMSFAMTYCVETLGKLCGISELVMGLTVSAAGTSFPNVFASMLVARQGYGNMAISNAFGSNVFNILMGLGLPWFLICMLGNHSAKVDGHVYHGMKSGGVAFPVIVLLVLLVGFMINMMCTGWRIYTSHAYVFIALYIGFLVWAFGWKVEGPDLGI
eukprot:TRINITY_DN1783_c3_g1_i1.p1 TRINITY_DN1783_c3_g1~~TRINITY_DN1783_c3_g1_i1.p1  ORF type:complete len:742 (+),score=221.37 TRINITY_DN1783_c3_g1_i1:94-2319(+)